MKISSNHYLIQLSIITQVRGLAFLKVKTSGKIWWVGGDMSLYGLQLLVYQYPDNKL